RLAIPGRKGGRARRLCLYRRLPGGHRRLRPRPRLVRAGLAGCGRPDPGPRIDIRARPVQGRRVTVNEGNTMTLRSLSANSPGRRANWKALGLSQEDMLKPKIAVVNSSS